MHLYYVTIICYNTCYQYYCVLEQRLRVFADVALHPSRHGAEERVLIIILILIFTLILILILILILMMIIRCRRTRPGNHIHNNYNDTNNTVHTNTNNDDTTNITSGN